MAVKVAGSGTTSGAFSSLQASSDGVAALAHVEERPPVLPRTDRGAGRIAGALGSMDPDLNEALRSASRGERAFDAVWIGDSISELNQYGLMPLPWQVGDLVMRRSEPVQFRNASDDPYSPTMDVVGTTLAPELAGLAGRSSILEPGERASLASGGTGVTVLWSRRPGGGSIEVRWADEVLGTVETDGPRAWSRCSTLRSGRDHHLDAELVLEAVGAPVEIEGVYIHHTNLDRGVRVWPAVRSGSRSADFVTHSGWALEAIESLRPDLVVLATGTNDGDSYGEDLTKLVRAVQGASEGTAVCLWLPPVNREFTRARAAIGREVALREGCSVIDAAAELGQMPTVDGVHPTPFTISMAAHHAASCLRGEDGGAGIGAVADLFEAAMVHQVWRPALGSISIEKVLYSSVLVGREGEIGNEEVVWAIACPPAGESVLGLPGPVFTMGPGNGAPTDTHLSRTGPGTFGINGGHGELSVGSLRLAPRSGQADDAVVVEVDLGGPSPRFAARTPSHGTRWLGLGGAAIEVPLPCALAAHVGAEGRADLTGGDVLWVPLPALATPALATHVWVDVVGPVPGSTATMSVAGSGPGGLPGPVLGATAAGAVDLAARGVCGAELAVPVEVPMAQRWWVRIVVEGAAPVGLRGARSLAAPMQVELGVAPVVPNGASASGALVPVAEDGSAQSHGFVAHLGVAPTVHISLEGAAEEPASAGN